MARRTISRRFCPEVVGFLFLWGGSEVGTNRTRSRRKASLTSSALRRWPQWIGSKVPPKRPIFIRNEGGLSAAHSKEKSNSLRESGWRLNRCRFQVSGLARG